MRKKIISGGQRYISRFPEQPAPFNHSYKTGNENVHKIKEKRRKTNHPCSVMWLSHVAHLCLKSYKITCKNADNKWYMVSIFVNAPLRLQSIRISVSCYPIWYHARGGSLGWIVAPLCTFNMQIAWPIIVLKCTLKSWWLLGKEVWRKRLKKKHTKISKNNERQMCSQIRIVKIIQL